MKPKPITYEIGIVAVASVGTGRYRIGTFRADNLSDAMEVLSVLAKLPRPTAVNMAGGVSYWIHEGDLLFVAPAEAPCTPTE